MLLKMARAAVAVLLCAALAVPAQAMQAAILVEAQSGRVLVEKNAREGLPMASTTKIMTALLTLEQEKLDDYFTVDADAIHVEGSSMGLCEGDRVTLRTLAAGMLLPSGNDAANAAAVRIAGNIPDFVKQMNERAEALGMSDTRFETPSGLDAEGHYSSARDLALLARVALQNPAFAELCKRYRMTLEYGNPPFRRWLKNHNRLLEDYEGAIGVKTGFTKKAGRCLVSAAQREGVTLICVTLACPDDWHAHTALLDEGFARLKSTELSALLPPLRLAVGGGTAASVALRPARPVTAALAEGEQARVTAEALLPRFALAPLQAGQSVGEIRLLLEGTELARIPLCVAEEISARPLNEKKGWMQRITELFAGKKEQTK